MKTRRENLTETDQRDALARIENLVKEAQAKLDEAAEVADEYGVVFSARVNNARNTYKPKGATFPAERVDEEGYWGGDFDGWEHSDFCPGG